MKTKNNFIYLLILIVASATNSFAQINFVKLWDKTYGSTSDEQEAKMIRTADGGFMLACYSNGPIGADKSEDSVGNVDFWIIKLDANGIKQWDKVYGGTKADLLHAIIQTSDGGYLLGGNSSSDSSGDRTVKTRGLSDYWIVKIDDAGIKQWDAAFGGTSDDWLYGMTQTKDGGYVLAGGSYSGIGGDKSQARLGLDDYWIVRIDAVGKKIWDKNYGGSNYDLAFDIVETPDSGFLVGGYSYSGVSADKTDPSKGGGDVWMVKLYVNGTKQWDKTIGGSGDDGIYTIIPAAGNKYLLGGDSNSGVSGDKTDANKGLNDLWIVMIDSAGKPVWDKDYGGIDDDIFGSLIATVDGGYAIGAYSRSDSSGDKTENNLAGQQTWVIKTNAVGTIQWDKTLFTDNYGHHGMVEQTNDGCYVVATSTASGIGGYKTEPNRDLATGATYDFWIIKFCDKNTSKTCAANFSIVADTTQLHHYYVVNNCTGLGPLSYNWSWGDGTNDYIAYPSHTYLDSGYYDVCVTITDTLGCSDTFCDSAFYARQKQNYMVYMNVVASIPTGVHSLAATEEFNIYPNPVSNILQMSVTSVTAADPDVSILNTLGKFVYRQNNFKDIDVSSLSPGIYFIKVHTGSTLVTGKFIKD